jgi:ABC-type transport system substrate-binding protein
LTAQARRADTITIGVTDLPNTLDSGEAYDFHVWEVLSHLYTGLTRQIPGTIEYELALASAVRVSEDRLTYTFTLRDDAAFSDGTPITAQTFVDSIGRVLALKRGAADAVEPYVASVVATTSGKLVFRLTRPVPYFLGLVSLPPYFPQYPDLAQSEQPQPFPAHLIGNGPYLLGEFRVRDQITLTVNPHYTFGPPPSTPTIILRRYPRSQDLRDALRDHEVDLAWTTLYLGHVTELQSVAGLRIVEQPSARVFYLTFNHNREPFDDPGARRAITLLLDRASVAQTALNGHVTPLISLVPAEFPDAYAPIWPDDNDIAQAEIALRDAGYRPRGQAQLQFEIGYSLQTYGQTYLAGVAQIVQREFGASEYVAVRLRTDIDTPTLISVLERGEAREAMFFAWTPIAPHPDAYLRPLAHSAEPIPRNGGYARPQLDTLLDDAAQLDDPAEQGARYREVAALLLEDHDLAPIWQDHLFVVAWDDIEGILVEPNFLLHYDWLARK